MKVLSVTIFCRHFNAVSEKPGGQAVRKKLRLVIAATPTDLCAMCISILLHNTKKNGFIVSALLFQ